MATIMKIYTAEQLYTMYKNKILADNVGLTDFNEGSKIRSLLESNSEIVSSIAMDIKEGTYKAIPIALYDGFNFNKKASVSATGYLRPYRKPALWISYSGVGTVAAITTNATNFSATCTGAGGDDFDFDYVSYPTIDDIVTAIDALGNWSATLVKDASIASDTLYQYSAVDAIGATNYLNTTGLDIMLDDAIEIEIITGYSVSIDNLTILTTADATLEAGESGVTIEAEAQTAGTTGNISASAVDTLNGKGSINSSVDGIEYVINDSAFSGGSDAETTSERATRFFETVNALNAGTKNGILAAIKAIDGVRSVGMRTGYPVRGNNTIVVDDGSGSGPLSAALEAEIEKVLYGDPSDFVNYPGKNAEGIGYTITTPDIIPVNVTAQVFKLDSSAVDSTEIQTDVQTAIEQYINTRGLGYDVLVSEIIRVAKNSNAGVYDITVSVPLSNVTITDSQFAKTGSGTGASVTITVTETSV